MKINRRGLIGTLTIHGLVLVLLVLGGLTFPDPPPEEEGILVNFGTDDSGFGTVEPERYEENQGNPDPEITGYEPEEAVQVPQREPVDENIDPVNNTQDVEEVLVKEDPKPTKEEIRKQQEELERIKKKEEEERSERIERERIENEQEAERQRLEAERLKKEEVANKLNNLGKNTFGQQSTGEVGGSEGVNPGTGTNQGTVNGSPGAPNYGDRSGLGTGTSYGLGGRKVVGELPKPNVDDCNVTSRIVVTVEIQVDQSGKVLSATVLSATFADKCIWEVVVQAARDTKFTSDETAAFRQTGWIKYTIEP